MVIKQSCRTLDFEQLLFLEIFELLHKFGSNLYFKSNGNFVNTVNSARGRHLIADELLFRSGRRRGHPWLRAGVEKATAWLPCASGPRFKTEKSSPFFSSSPLFFQSSPPLLRRAFAAVVVPPSRQSLFQLRLLLARPANPSI